MVDWNRPLTRVLILKSGEQLRTLHDAASLVSKRFGHSAALEHTIARLLRAAETGARGRTARPPRSRSQPSCG